MNYSRRQSHWLPGSRMAAALAVACCAVACLVPAGASGGGSANPAARRAGVS